MSENNLGTIWAEVGLDYAKHERGVQEVIRRNTHLEQQTEAAAARITQHWDRLGKQMSLALTAPLTLLARQMVNTFASFEQSMANTQAVAQATAVEFDKMREAAMLAGSTTVFSASQAADAMYSLAAAGMDAEQTISALEGTLSLAAATNVDLAFASSAVASTLSQFALEASEAERVANLFAAAMAGSQASAAKLTDSLRYAGPVAAGFGHSVEETTAALMALYNAGLQGEQAGTTLRRAMLELANPVGDAVNVIRELGLSVNQLHPEMNSLTDIIDTLNGAGIDATQTMRLFGSVAGSGMVTLLRGGSATLREFEAQITGTAEATKMAQIQLDNLPGDIKLVQSAFEGLSISLSQNFNEIMRTVAQNTADVLNWLSDLDPPIQRAIVSFGALVAAMGPFLLITKQLLAVLPLLMGPAGIIFGGVAALSALALAMSGTNRDMSQFYHDSVRMSNASRDQANNLRQLVDEYQQLSGKPSLSEAEHRRLEQVMQEIIAIQPTIAHGYDTIREAIEANIGTLENYILTLQRQSEIQLRQAQLEGQVRRNLLDAELESLEKRKRVLEEKIQPAHFDASELTLLESRLDTLMTDYLASRRVGWKYDAEEIAAEIRDLISSFDPNFEFGPEGPGKWHLDFQWILQNTVRETGNWVSELVNVEEQIANIQRELEAIKAVDEALENLHKPTSTPNATQPRAQTQTAVPGIPGFTASELEDQLKEQMEEFRAWVTLAENNVEYYTTRAVEFQRTVDDYREFLIASINDRTLNISDSFRAFMAGELASISETEDQLVEKQAQMFRNQLNLVRYAGEQYEQVFGELGTLTERYGEFLNAIVANTELGISDELRARFAEEAYRLQETFEEIQEMDFAPSVAQMASVWEAQIFMLKEGVAGFADDLGDLGTYMQSYVEWLNNLISDESVEETTRATLVRTRNAVEEELDRLGLALTASEYSDAVLRMADSYGVLGDRIREALSIGQISFESRNLEEMERRIQNYYRYLVASGQVRLGDQLAVAHERIRGLKSGTDEWFQGMSEILRVQRMIDAETPREMSREQRIGEELAYRRDQRDLVRFANEQYEEVYGSIQDVTEGLLQAIETAVADTTLSSEFRARLSREAEALRRELEEVVEKPPIAEESVTNAMRVWEAQINNARRGIERYVEELGSLEEGLERYLNYLNAMLDDDSLSAIEHDQVGRAREAVTEELRAIRDVTTLTAEEIYLQVAGLAETYGELAGTLLRRAFSEDLDSVEEAERRIENIYRTLVASGEVSLEEQLRVANTQLQLLEEGTTEWLSKWQEAFRLEARIDSLPNEALQETLELFEGLKRVNDEAVSSYQSQVAWIEANVLAQEGLIQTTEEARRIEDTLFGLRVEHYRTLAQYEDLTAKERLKNFEELVVTHASSFEQMQMVTVTRYQLEQEIAREQSEGYRRAVQLFNEELEVRRLTLEEQKALFEDVLNKQVPLAERNAEVLKAIDTRLLQFDRQIAEEKLRISQRVYDEEMELEIARLEQQGEYRDAMLLSAELALERRLRTTQGNHELIELAQETHRVRVEEINQRFNAQEERGSRETAHALITNRARQLELEGQILEASLLRQELHYQRQVEMYAGNAEMQEVIARTHELEIAKIKQDARQRELVEIERMADVEAQLEIAKLRGIGEIRAAEEAEVRRERDRRLKSVEDGSAEALLIHTEYNNRMGNISKRYADEELRLRQQLNQRIQELQIQHLRNMGQLEEAEIAGAELRRDRALAGLRDGQSEDAAVIWEQFYADVEGIEQRYAQQRADREARELAEAKRREEDWQQFLVQSRQTLAQEVLRSKIEELQGLLASEELSASERLEIERNLQRSKYELAKQALEDQLTLLDVMVLEEEISFGDRLEILRNIRREYEELYGENYRLTAEWIAIRQKELQVEKEHASLLTKERIRSMEANEKSIRSLREKEQALLALIESTEEYIDKQMVLNELMDVRSGIQSVEQSTLRFFADLHPQLNSSINQWQRWIRTIQEAPQAFENLNAIMKGMFGEQGGILGGLLGGAAGYQGAGGGIAGILGGITGALAGAGIGGPWMAAASAGFSIIGQLLDPGPMPEHARQIQASIEAVKGSLEDFGVTFDEATNLMDEFGVELSGGFLGLGRTWSVVGEEAAQKGMEIAEALIRSMSTTMQGLTSAFADALSGRSSWDDFQRALGDQMRRAIIEEVMGLVGFEEQVKLIVGKIHQGIRDGSLTEDEVRKMKDELRELFAEANQEMAFWDWLDDIFPDGNIIEHEVRGVQITRMAGQDRDLFIELLRPISVLDQLPDTLGNLVSEAYLTFLTGSIASLHAQTVIMEQVHRVEFTGVIENVHVDGETLEAVFSRRLEEWAEEALS